MENYPSSANRKDANSCLKCTKIRSAAGLRLGLLGVAYALLYYTHKPPRWMFNSSRNYSLQHVPAATQCTIAASRICIMSTACLPHCSCVYVSVYSILKPRLWGTSLPFSFGPLSRLSPHPSTPLK